MSVSPIYSTIRLDLSFESIVLENNRLKINYNNGIKQEQLVATIMHSFIIPNSNTERLGHDLTNHCKADCR